MKTLIISGYVLLFCIALFFGLSSVTINQTQHQKQTQQQIQRNDNIQLTIIDSSKKIKDIKWECTTFFEKKDMLYYLNTQFNYFQVRESKIVKDANRYSIIYPVLNTKAESYTNSSESYNTNYNKIKLNLLGRFK